LQQTLLGLAGRREVVRGQVGTPRLVDAAEAAQDFRPGRREQVITGQELGRPSFAGS
jgi:hypothetical protein